MRRCDKTPGAGVPLPFLRKAQLNAKIKKVPVATPALWCEIYHIVISACCTHGQRHTPCQHCRRPWLVRGRTADLRGVLHRAPPAPGVVPARSEERAGGKGGVRT